MKRKRKQKQKHSKPDDDEFVPLLVDDGSGPVAYWVPAELVPAEARVPDPVEEGDDLFSKLTK